MSDSHQTIKRTFCTICPQHCGVLVTVQDGRPISVKGDPKSPIAGGRLCIKGPRAIDLFNHPDRLNFPLKRVGERGAMKWEKISWEQALDEIAMKLADLRDQHGPESLATLGGTHKGPGDWSSWRFCSLYGTPNFINQGRNCGVGHIVAETAVYGYDTMYAAIYPGETKLTIIWGSNPAESGTAVMQRLREGKKKGMTLVVVDPRRTKAAEEADVWVQVRPRTSGALALGMAHVILREGLHDREFVNRYCEGFDDIKKVVDQYPPERASLLSGVPVETIEKVARLYATTKPARFVPGIALVQDGQGASRSSVLARTLLVSLTGNVDVKGGDPLAMKLDDSQIAWVENMHWDKLVNHPLRKHDTLGAEEHPIIGTKAYQLFCKAQERLHPKGHYAAEYILFANQNAIYRSVLTEKPYPVKAIIVQNGEPLLSMGGVTDAYRAFHSANLDLLVTMDLFMTPTAQLSDYVLPAAHYLERPDISTHWGLTHVFVCGEQAVEPLYERRNDYDFWKGLGHRLGQEAYWPDTLEGMLDRFLAPSGRPFAEWAQSKRNFHAPQLRYKKYETEGFATFSGKVELAPSIFKKVGINPLPEYEGPPYSMPEVDDPARYPYQMIAGSRIRYFMASNLHQVEFLRKKYPDPPVWIHPETAARHGIQDGDWVLIERPEGAIRQLALITDKIRPDTVQPECYWWYPEKKPGEPGLSGLWEANANALTATSVKLCSFAGDQPLRGGRCRIAPADRPEISTADLIAGLQVTYNDLNRMVRFLDDSSLDQINRDQKVTNTLSRLTDADRQARELIMQLIAEGASSTDRTPSAANAYQTRPEPVLDKLWASRKETLMVLEHLPPEKLSCNITHPALGDISIESLLWHLAREEAKETETIRRCLIA